MGLGLDLNAIAASAYNAIKELQNAATELVGLECLWCRAVPVENSEDIILQEYTLTRVGFDQPKIVNVINQNNEYNPGNLTIDLFGAQYEQPLEINITMSEWQTVYGYDTMPQAGDVVYVKIYHKLFEVKTSTQIYSVGANPMYYKCQLVKYHPKVNRDEEENMRNSIESLTTSQEILFGDKISQEVADNNATVETSYNNTTFVDPVKSFDINSIISEQVYGAEYNIISNAYYNFKNANQNIIYNTDLIYETSADRNHLIYSCWFKNNNVDIESGIIKKMTYFSKDRKYWNFIIGTTLKLNIGDEVTITRGNLLKITGTIVTLPCEGGLGVQFKTADITKANKKLTKWYEQTAQLKIYKTTTFNILSGYSDNDNIIFDISYTNTQINFVINGMSKYASINLSTDTWHYMLIDISPNNIRYIISSVMQSQKDVYIDKVIADNNIPIELSDFTVSYFGINNMEKDIYMCNIRLYENEYPITDEYMLDMYSPVTRNASKLILVDSPNVPNKSQFVSPIR